MKIELTKIEKDIILKHVQSEVRRCRKNLDQAKISSNDMSNGVRISWRNRIPEFENDLKCILELEIKLNQL